MSFILNIVSGGEKVNKRKRCIQNIHKKKRSVIITETSLEDGERKSSFFSSHSNLAGN